MDILTDDEVWNRLHHALAVIGEARGATGFGANTLDSARLALTALQMAVIYKTDALAPAPIDPGFITLPVLLPPEAVKDLEAFILRSMKRYTMQEAVVALVAEALARRKMFLTGR